MNDETFEQELRKFMPKPPSAKLQQTISGELDESAATIGGIWRRRSLQIALALGGMAAAVLLVMAFWPGGSADELAPSPQPSHGTVANGNIKPMNKEELIPVRREEVHEIAGNIKPMNKEKLILLVNLVKEVSDPATQPSPATAEDDIRADLYDVTVYAGPIGYIHGESYRIRELYVPSIGLSINNGIPDVDESLHVVKSSKTRYEQAQSTGLIRVSRNDQAKFIGSVRLSRNDVQMIQRVFEEQQKLAQLLTKATSRPSAPAPNMGKPASGAGK